MNPASLHTTTMRSLVSEQKKKMTKSTTEKQPQKTQIRKRKTEINGYYNNPVL